MKLSVFIALVGIAAATQRHQQKSFIQTKFISFAEDEEEKPADPVDVAPADAEPTPAQKKAREELDAKAAKIKTATKEVEDAEIADALKSNKEKAKDAKKLKKIEAKAAELKEKELNDADDKACAAKKNSRQLITREKLLRLYILNLLKCEL